MNIKPKKDFNTYQIKTGDTLKSIAKALNKDTNEVARFHNIFANQDELIGINFPKNLKQLYITPLLSEKHIDNIPKVKFLYDAKLALKPFKEKQDYNVNVYRTINNETLVLSYKKTVAYQKQLGELHLFEINSTSENENLEGIIIELSAEIEKAIYPIELVVNDDGNWISIHNFKSIYKRWQIVKTTIYDNFEGVEIDKRLAFYDILFQDEERCTNLLQKDVFLQAFFNNVYANHTLGFSLERELEFAIEPNVKGVSYHITQEIEEYVNPKNKIEILQKGIFADERSIMDFMFDLDEAYYTTEMPSGNYNALYLLNSSSNCIENIRLDCDLKSETSKEITITIELV